MKGQHASLYMDGSASHLSPPGGLPSPQIQQWVLPTLDSPVEAAFYDKRHSGNKELSLIPLGQRGRHSQWLEV